MAERTCTDSDGFGGLTFPVVGVVECGFARENVDCGGGGGGRRQK